MLRGKKEIHPSLIENQLFTRHFANTVSLSNSPHSLVEAATEFLVYRSGKSGPFPKWMHIYWASVTCQKVAEHWLSLMKHQRDYLPEIMLQGFQTRERGGPLPYGIYMPADNKLEISKAYLLTTSLSHQASETTPSLLVSKKNKEQRKNANWGTFSSLMLFTRSEHHLWGKNTLSPLWGVQDLNYRCKLTRKFWNIACPFKLSFINILQGHS